ncbi:MAG TPA: hypothetical protein PK544_17320, partial [Spirochaetota bacterium]|nr:hypothetical protein [Spirochaetota bacterium]
HEGAHSMNRSSFTTLPNSKYGECSKVPLKRPSPLESREGVQKGERQRLSPFYMQSIIWTQINSGHADTV